MALQTGSGTEPLNISDVLFWDQPHEFCRSVETLILGTSYIIGHVLGKITASGKFSPHDAGLADGSEAAAGVCLVNIDATSADKVEVILVKGPAIVKADNLTWKSGISAPDLAAGIAALLALGIEVRS